MIPLEFCVSKCNVKIADLIAINYLAVITCTVGIFAWFSLHQVFCISLVSHLVLEIFPTDKLSVSLLDIMMSQKITLHDNFLMTLVFVSAFLWRKL